MAGPTIEIAPPVRTPRTGGLSKVATFRTNDRLGVAASVVFQSDGCEFPKTEKSRCIETAPVPDKTFAGIAIEDAIGAPFTIYAGVECFAGPEPDELARAERTLAEGEDRTLEEVLGAWASGGTVLAVGSNIPEAIAIVEQELDSKYVGQGIILMSRHDTIFANSNGNILDGDVRSDGILVTVNGTPVLASGKVAPGTVYGLGAIVVEKSTAFSHELVDPTHNKIYALAEANYVLAVDCEFRVLSNLV